MTKNVELQLTNDYIFKRLFSKKGNEDILKDLLEGILEIP
ncbi:MAG: PD-(D/E)XK nuclease family transposase, partial [Clostridium sp.]|nr:PD-(D/E)XK nuclease family transposase [Clostridium sp.]